MHPEPLKPESLKYDTDIDVNADSAHAKVLALVGGNKRVLELGCSTGYMSRIFRDRGCQVVAVEIDPEAAGRAAAFCERVVVGDLDRLDLSAELGEDRFDVVVAADVLEHLRDPLALLRQVKRHLKPDGFLVASIPNIAHGSVRLGLLAGLFPNDNRVGLLDRTHLRFFTRQTMEELLDAAGFAIGRLVRQEKVIIPDEVPYDPAQVPPELLASLSHDPEAMTYQFVVVAYPLPRDELERVRALLKAAAVAREAAERRARDAEQQAAESSAAADAARAQAEQSVSAAASAAQQAADAARAEAQAALAAQRAEAEAAVAAERAQAQQTLKQADEEHRRLRAELRATAEANEAAVRATEHLRRQLESVNAERTEAQASLAAERSRSAHSLKRLHEEQDRLRDEVRALMEAHEAAGGAAAELRQRLDAATAERDAARQRAAQLEEAVAAARRELEEKTIEFDDLAARLELMVQREVPLRKALVEVQERVVRLEDEWGAAGSRAAEAAKPVEIEKPAEAVMPPAISPYHELVQRVRDVVVATVPPGATVAVVSKGDDQLLKLDGRTGFHFPQNETGGYAGFNPADSADAIARVEAARSSGTRFLVFPSTAAWWLEHYADLCAHLQARFRLLRQDDTCSVWSLEEPQGQEQTEQQPPKEPEQPSPPQEEQPQRQEQRQEQAQPRPPYEDMVARIRGTVQTVIPREGTLLVVSKGDDQLLDLGGRSAEHFPQGADGRYAGYHPADSAAAIAQLEARRARYLLLPRTAFWWLTHYQELKQYLDRVGQRIHGDDDCIVYDLTPPGRPILDVGKASGWVARLMGRSRTADRAAAGSAR